MKLRTSMSEQYHQICNELIVQRVRVMTLIGAVLYMSFSYLDPFYYPDHAYFFIRIRFAVVALFVLTHIASAHPFIKRNIMPLWYANFIVSTGGLSLMIFQTNGVLNRYYEGIELIVLAILISNSFYYLHNLILVCVVLAGYLAAVLFCPAGLDNSHFLTVIFYLVSTMFFVVLMSRFYGLQHLKQFIQSEELRRSQKKLAILYNEAEKRSKIDDLTKIYNRRHFFNVLADKIKASAETASEFYLVIFDIDHFKRINDAWGHAFGDQVMKTVAQTVRRNINPRTYIGRYGGDEFMIIIDKATPEEFMKRLTKIREVISSIPLKHEDKKLRISASFGAAKYMPGHYDVEKLIDLADQALLQVKHSRRGFIHLAN